MRVLIIGAAGRIGSAATASCLARNFDTTAFVRSPSKLSEKLRSHPKLRVVKGDATSYDDLVQAMQGQDAIIQSAVYGSNSPTGTSDSELVVRTVVSAALHVQSERHDAPLRLWVLAGQVLMDVPSLGEGTIQGDFIPIHPEHYKNHAYLKSHAAGLDWSMLCPGKVDEGEPKGPVIKSIDSMEPWYPPFIIGRIPIIGPRLNMVYNWFSQHLTYHSIGEFLAGNLGPGGDMRGKRVCIVENVYGSGAKTQ